MVNYDCVGLGYYFVLIMNKKFSLPDESLRETFDMLPEVIFTNGRRANANSDHLNFDQGIAVLACKKSKCGLLYTDRIHTPKDTEVSDKNIFLLRDAALSYIEKL